MNGGYIILGMLGGPEIIIIAVIILLIFGGKKLPELMKGIGKGIHDFKKATRTEDGKNGIDDIRNEINNISSEIDKASKPAKTIRDITTGKKSNPAG